MTINDSLSYSTLHNQRYTDTVIKAVERINSGLKINDVADDSASAIIVSSLKNNASSLLKGIENANEGLGVVSVTNKALSYQEDILNEIKTKLEYVRDNDLTNTQKSEVKDSIDNSINKFDDIASSTTYNSLYTLQKSNTDNDYSSSKTFTFNAESSNSVTTSSIRSNSTGVNLTDLKNLDSNDLSYENITTQLSNVDSAIETLNEYKDAFTLTQTELKISIENLTSIEKSTSAEVDALEKADISKEQAIIDKYKLVTDSSEYALAQANTNQAAVLNLLTDVAIYEPTNKTNESETYEYDNNETKDANSYEKDDTYEYKETRSTTLSSGSSSKTTSNESE